MLTSIASCAANAQRISAMQEAPLSFRPQLALLIHLAGCRMCRRYRRQIRLLHQILPRYGEHLEQSASETLPAEARRKIKQLLRTMPG